MSEVLRVQLPTGDVLLVCTVSGPSSYTTGGFTVNLPLEDAKYAAVVNVTGGYYASIASVDRNRATVVVYYQTGASGTPLAEVAAGRNLSGVTFTLLAVGR